MRKVGKRRKNKKRFTTWSLLWLLCRYSYRLAMYPPAFIILFLLIIFAGFYYTGYYHKTTHAINTQIIGFYQRTGLTLKDVYLEGQHYTPDEDIINVINVEIGMPMSRINIHQIKENLEKLPWIKYAVVERLLPSTLSIRMIERKPIALWQYNNQVFLIDNQGAIIPDQDLAPFSQLVILVGEDAPSHVEELLTMLEYNPDVSMMISSAIRVGQRRWNIRLRNGIEIKLPEYGGMNAWKQLVDMHQTNDVLNSPNKVIDLRVDKKIFVKPK